MSEADLSLVNGFFLCNDLTPSLEVGGNNLKLVLECLVEGERVAVHSRFLNHFVEIFVVNFSLAEFGRRAAPLLKGENICVADSPLRTRSMNET